MRSEGGGGEGLLLERERELGVIRWRLREAVAGRGGAVVVEGAAGIGKTAVLAAGRGAAEEAGFRVARARGAELEREFAFGVVRQLFELVLVEASVQERAFLLDGAAGLAARLLGLPGAPGVGGEAAVAPDPSFAVLHGLYWLCANLAVERPLVLVVDDAHWADVASLRFLVFLLSRLEELRVVVLLACRPAETGVGEGLLERVLVDPVSEVVRPAALSTGAVARLVEEGLGRVPEPGFAEACRDATGGTPFLVGRLVDALRDERVAPVDASAAGVQDMAAATLGRWAVLQLGRLGRAAASLARAVAVLESAEPSEAARLAGLEAEEAARTASLLVRAGVLEERPLAFAHSVLRAAVYREIAPGARSEAHRRAARLLGDGSGHPARVANHLLAAAPAGDGWVVEQLAGAARAAAGTGAPESAAAYLRRALAEPPSPQARGGLLLQLGLAELSAGQAEWRGHLEAAVDEAGDEAGRVAAALALANALGLHQRSAEAVDVLDSVAAGLEAANARARLVLDAMAVAWGVLDAAHAPLVAGRAAALLAAAGERSLPPGVLAIAAYVAALANEPADRVARLARRAIAASRGSAPEAGEPPWLASAAFALLWAEKFDEAQALLDAALARARTQANGLVLPPVLSLRARLAVRRGDLMAAEADARSLLAVPELSASMFYRLLATTTLVDVLSERGELGEAERALEPLELELEGISVTAAGLRGARGRLRLAQWRFREGLEDILAAGDVITRTGTIAPAVMPWRSDAALAQLALGDRDAAQALSAQEVSLARAFGAPRALAVALRVAGLAAGGRSGEPLLREAIEILDTPDTRLERARAMADLGALLRRDNHRAEARDLLRHALDIAHRAGATPLADRAETELRATGARPRRLLLSGVEALTASERRIAELAADGLTNREIAQNLFVTARTVEGHLTNVFHKLQITTRTELDAALHRKDASKAA